MKRFGNLFESVTAFDNLFYAAYKALRGKKHKMTAADFYFNMENELLALEQELKTKTYRPMPYRTFYVYEPKKRKICSAVFRDRVVHHAVCNIIEPIFDRAMIFDTYACRKGKGTHAAVKQIQKFSHCFQYFLKCDIRKYFETIDHNLLKTLLARKIKDKSLLNLLDIIIDHAVPESEPCKSIPIGNLTSQLFANLYLGELDHFIKDRLAIRGYVRYMDDFILFSQEKSALWEHLLLIREFVSDRLFLELKKEVQIIAPVYQGIPFLGFRIFPKIKRLDRVHLVRFTRKIRKREEEYKQGMIDEDFLSRSVSSMVAHITHANTYNVKKKIFLDSLKTVC